MKFVFCYDITDKKVLTKVAKKLEKHGVRVQYSIFELIEYLRILKQNA